MNNLQIIPEPNTAFASFSCGKTTAVCVCVCITLEDRSMKKGRQTLEKNKKNSLKPFYELNIMQMFQTRLIV